MTKNSIGLIELTSIAAGYEVGDAMLKAADVEILLSRSICSGKYMVLIGGDVSAVKSSVDAGTVVGKGCVIDTFVIPNVHASVFPAIAGAAQVENFDALGIIESFSVASLIEGSKEISMCGRRNIRWTQTSIVAKVGVLTAVTDVVPFAKR